MFIAGRSAAKQCFLFTHLQPHYLCKFPLDDYQILEQDHQTLSIGVLRTNPKHQGYADMLVLCDGRVETVCCDRKMV